MTPEELRKRLAELTAFEEAMAKALLVEPSGDDDEDGDA